MMDYEPIPCFKAYDIRGKVPRDLNVELAVRVGKALVRFLDAKRIVVGHDIRQSSQGLCDALIKGITEAGADVEHIGLCGTEMVYFATSHLGADGGVMITASHNPPEYNGMKIVREGSRPVSGDTGLKDIERMASLGVFPPSAGGGRIRETDIMDDYIERVLEFVNVDAVKPMKVVVNAGNGCAGPAIDKLEARLPVEFVKVHHEPDPSFPNGVPNPMIVENRQATIEAVRQSGAAMGVAFDGDYDRCFLFDERGNYIEGYYIVGFLAQTLLEKNPGGKIVYDPRLTWNTIELVEQNGGVPLQSKSGHSFIKELMRKEEAVYGGEMSCHHYFKEFAYCDSGMIPWLLLLEILSRTGKPISELVRERIEAYPVSGEINNEVEDQDAVLERIKAHYEPQNPKTDFTDGISFEFGNWRFNVRKSNTEPILRLNVESRRDKALLEEKTNELLGLIRGGSPPLT